MNRNKKIALAKHLGCRLSELHDSKYDENSVEYGNQEWRVLTDDEADIFAKEYIKDSVWAFNPDFLKNYIPVKARIIELVQRECCEDCNELFVAAIGDKFDDFVRNAIAADGRGHFMSSYDGEETEVDLLVGKNQRQYFFAYRVN